MSITRHPNGKWKVRIAVPTSRKNAKGNTMYRDITKSFDTKGAAETWERTQRAQFEMTGSEATLNISEVVEYRAAKEKARGIDLREIVDFWLERHADHRKRYLVKGI